MAVALQLVTAAKKVAEQGHMDWWAIGADLGIMLTGLAVLPGALAWSYRQVRGAVRAVTRRRRLRPGGYLRAGRSLYSPSGKVRFTLLHDANMVVSVDGYGVFADTGTVGEGIADRLTLRRDGWLVLTNTSGEPIWWRGPGSMRLEVQDNAHVVLYPKPPGKAIWATDWLLIRGQPVPHTGPGSSAKQLPAAVSAQAHQEGQVPAVTPQETFHRAIIRSMHMLDWLVAAAIVIGAAEAWAQWNSRRRRR